MPEDERYVSEIQEGQLWASRFPTPSYEQRLERSIRRRTVLIRDQEEELQRLRKSASIIDRFVRAPIAEATLNNMRSNLRRDKWALQTVRARLGKDPITGLPVPQ